MPLPPYTGPSGRHTSDDAPERSDNPGVLSDDDGPASRIQFRPPLLVATGRCDSCGGLCDDAGRCRCTT